MKDSDADDAAPVLDRDRARALRKPGTPAERMLWQRLRNRQLKGAKFRRNHPIIPYFADFFCLEARLVIELDGSQHGEDLEKRADQRRTAALRSLGYKVLRFWNEEVLDNIDGVLETIACHL